MDLEVEDGQVEFTLDNNVDGDVVFSILENNTAVAYILTPDQAERMKLMFGYCVDASRGNIS